MDAQDADGAAVVVIDTLTRLKARDRPFELRWAPANAQLDTPGGWWIGIAERNRPGYWISTAPAPTLSQALVLAAEWLDQEEL